MGRTDTDGTSRATAVVLSVGSEELRGLCALAELAAASSGERVDLEGTATALLHAAVESRLADARLPWAPSEEAVRKRAAEAAKPDGAFLALVKGGQTRRYAGSALAVATLVVLWGGYVYGWKWTGFRSNEQLWDWLHLLLLPVVAGTIPLWLRHAGPVSMSRRVGCLIAAAALGGFVLAGYLVPLGWTGFSGNTLWDWLGLVLLPLAIASIRFLPSLLRSLRRYHHWAFGALGLAWTVTIVGGYGWHWTWTGYQGNTLWDWLQLLLLPLVVPTILLPATVRWISGNASKHAPAAARARTSPT